MVEKTRYRRVETLGKTTGSCLYRAWRSEDGEPVLVKQLDPKRPDAAQEARLRREYEVLRSLDVSGIVHPVALIEEPGGPAMILENFPGERLEGILGRGRMDLAACLRAMSRLAGILAAVHHAQLIHNGIQPANLLFHPGDCRICIADFSLATSSGLEACPAGIASGFAENDLPYVSPEQTGRMNRPVDHRTDFYSLGVCFYRMLTGRLPFQVHDPLEWVHCHIARVPPAPGEVAPDIPQPVSDIACKLLAKTADERYQSAAGLQADLDHCLSQWEAKRRIDAFTLGKRDLSERFSIPQRLYGREAEIRALHGAFDQATMADDVRVVLLTGPAGIGKSSLAHALLQRVEQERGYFLSGKFDQFQQNIPYAAIADAFQKLAQRILGESDACIAEWRQRFSAALGGNGRLILDVIPQFEPILGPQPEVAALPPQEAQYRFHRVFRQFLDVVTGSGHTLALFLDDLHSADTASLALLRYLLAEPGPPGGAWLLIGAWRDQEAGPGHPLQRLLAAARQTRDPLEIRPAALDAQAIGRLVADTLHCAPASVRPLTRLIERKTGGNPFFINQFLHMLHRDGLIAFDPQRARWIWYMAQIRDADVTGNVVELMADQIGRLPSATQKVLTLAACLGDRFTLNLLAAVAQEAPDRLAKQLLPEVQRGLLLAWDQDPGPAGRRYRWLHDRIRQAAYSLLAQSGLPRVHLDIGRALLAADGGRDPDEHLFEAANHLNAGAALMTDADERRRLAQLNLRAGRKAKASAAHAVAIRYLGEGIALLDQEAWTRDYALAFPLHFEQAECELLDGNPDAAIALSSLAMARARSRHDLALACQLKETSLLAKGDVAESVATTLEGLALLGIALPAHPTPEDAAAERARLQRLLNGRSIESLIELPAMTDPEQAAPMLIQTASYFTDPCLYALHVARMVALSLEHGNADASLMWYGCYSLILAGLGEYEDAQRFAALAYGLMERRKIEAFRTRACFYLAVSAFWVGTPEQAVAQAREGFGTLKETGDLISADYCGRLALLGVLDQRTLGEAREETMRLLEFGRRVSSRDLVDTCLLIRQFIDRLQDGNGDAGESFDPARLQHGSAQDRCSILGSWYWIFRMRAEFLFGNLAQALAAGEQAMPLLWVTACFIPCRDFCLYYALTLAALFDRAAPAQKQAWLPRLSEQQARLRRWSGLNPSTFRHADALVAAEIARINGLPGEAMRRYEESIQWARDGRFIQDEALACELAARFYQAQGFTVLTELHLKEARSCHARWGAARKVRQLESLYPQLAPRETDAARRGAIARLDALSVIKASQAISGEIVLDRLLDTLMRILLENAGAQHGYLVLVRDARTALAAEARVEHEQVQVQVRRQEEPPLPLLPQSIINYVRHSGEKILLADAREPNPFSQDPYLVQRHPKSVLCLPFLWQSELCGLLYLENNLATHAFTPDRLQVLELLASQAAISLANARLYDDVREREVRIQRLVESNVIGIVFCDISGHILEANETVARTVGYTREELLSGDFRWTDLVPPEHMPTVERSIAEGMQTGSCTPYEVEYIRKDGSRVPVLVGGALFEGSRDTGVAFVLDLTERKQAEAERAARRHAEAANEAKNAFLASMSHELKTPLNTILGFSQLMQRGTNLPPDVREDLAIILRCGEHLSVLLNQVLDLAKVESGHTMLHETDFDLASLLAELKDMFAYKASLRSLALEFAHENLPRFIRADPVKLRRVLINLLDNALKSARQGSVTMRIASFSTAAGLRLGVAVEDSGPGIGTHELAPLLAPFTRTGTGQTGQTEHTEHTEQGAPDGSGLGLAISRSFVRLMGGELRIDSRPGTGTTISFDIPVQPGRPGAVALPAGTVNGQVVALAPDQPRYRILVADDSSETRALLQRLLAPLGFDVRLADNGQEAIDIWKNWLPHLIWMDLRMPLVDGLAATRRIKAEAMGGATVIIALTASIFEEDRSEILQAGCADILIKPFREADLFALMQKHLGTRFVFQKEPALAGPAARLEADALAPLPEALRKALEQAVIRLDTHALKDALAQIRAHDAKLAHALEAMADEFEYENILQLIRKADGRIKHDGNNSGNLKFE